jgi:hypothetical protein
VEAIGDPLGNIHEAVRKAESREAFNIVISLRIGLGVAC